MSYNKGARGERELGELLSDRGFLWMRAPGSGTADRELPDVIAGKDGRLVVFEVKRWSNDFTYEYLDKKEVEDLILFANCFAAEYYVAYRFDRCSWQFRKKDELHETEQSYRCDKVKSAERIRTLEDI